MSAPDLTHQAVPADVDSLLSKTLSAEPVNQRARRTPLSIVLRVLSAVPVTALVLLVSMAVRVWITDGAWPERNAPDPKDLGVHNSATVFMILASFPAALLVPLLSLITARRGAGRTPIWPLLVGIVGFAVLLVVLRADVAGLGDWIGD